ncbi:MAG: hypothetical protein PVF45_03390 [Anaerolineae bacterium]|jgi:hypothetical protein
MGYSRYAWRYALGLVVVVCLLAVLLGRAGCRSGGIKVRSWEEAISFAQAELEKADQRVTGPEGDLRSLEERLDGYARVATNLGAQIELLDQARPALDAIDKLRDVDVPLVGNGWEILLAALSLVSVDGAKIIVKLEEVLRALAELKDDLDGLNSLPPVADAIRAFRATPNRRTLAALSATSATATPAMTQVHDDLGEVLKPLKEVADKLSGLVRGLRSAADSGIPAISDVAELGAERIGLIEEPLLTLRDGLDQLHQDIEADVKTLENIQEAVRQARKYSE